MTNAAIDETPSVRELRLLHRVDFRGWREPTSDAGRQCRCSGGRGLRAEGVRPGCPAPHRCAPSCFAADLARCGQEHQERQSADGELVGAEDARRHGQGRRRDGDHVADDAAGHRPRQGGGRPRRARVERIRQEARERSQGSLRHVRHAAFPARERVPRGNRLRLRHAEGRRHRLHDELRRQVAGLCRVRAGVGGAQPPQGHRLYASHRCQLLRQSGARHRRRLSRVRHRHDPLHLQLDLQRKLAEA